jgi:hypothetical protein
MRFQREWAGNFIDFQFLLLLDYVCHMSVGYHLLLGMGHVFNLYCNFSESILMQCACRTSCLFNIMFLVANCCNCALGDNSDSLLKALMKGA